MCYGVSSQGQQDTLHVCVSRRVCRRRALGSCECALPRGPMPCPMPFRWAAVEVWTRISMAEFTHPHPHSHPSNPLCARYSIDSTVRPHPHPLCARCSIESTVVRPLASRPHPFVI